MENTIGPILALAAGDPGSIGPEICVKALATASVRSLCRPIVIGWPSILQAAADQLHLGMKVRGITHLSQARFEPDLVEVYTAGGLQPDDVTNGKVSPASGLAAIEAVRTAARLALEGQIDGIVTGPIGRESLAAAGYVAGGQADILAQEAHTSHYAVMLVSGNLRCVLLSGAVPLREAIQLVSKENVLRTIRLAHEGCKRLEIGSPRIAVAGLNPYAAEDAQPWTEDHDEIRPAVEAACAEGIDAFGPLPLEKVFLLAARGEYSAVVTMYHAQAHIPLRMAAFKTAVVVVLSLPFVHTSVLHGPAFDIAGRALADPADMVEAIRLASRMVNSARTF